MAPRKEPKEQVYYPPSKRKAPPFKPLRPSGVPRVPTTDSESTVPTRTTKPPPPKRRKTSISNDDHDDDDDDSGTSDDLPANPLTSKSTKKPTPKRKPARQASPTSVSSEVSRTLSAEPEPPPGPSQSDTIPSIPQPLLVRLLHEHFADKSTKIDKHAIQVLQKYFEVFIRETIARAAERKREEVEKDGGLGVDGAEKWLELEDLEKVAAGMMLDF